MTDTPIAGPTEAPPAAAPGAAPTPAPQALPAIGGGLTQGQVASARAAWISYGHDPAVFDRAIGTATPAAPEGQETAPAPANTGTEVPAGPKGQEAEPPMILPQINSEMAQAMADQFIARGLDDTAVAAEMAKLGYEPDTRSEEQQAWDAAHGLDNARAPSDYRLDLSAMGLKGNSPAEVMAAQEAWGGFFAGMSIPPEMGVGLAEHISRTSRQMAARPATEQKMWAAEQQYQLRVHAGSDEAVKELKQMAGLAIKYAIDMAPNKTGALAVVKGMDEAGAFSDAHVLRTLSNWGRNLHEWMMNGPGQKTVA